MSEPRVLIAGASGLAGALAAALVERHPRLELAAVTARSEVGTPLERLHPRHRVAAVLERLESLSLADFDAAIVAYPHGAAAEAVAELRGAVAVVVDLSADFRLADLDTYGRWYGEHPAPALLDEAVYGLTELERERVRGAKLVANPGCYPTAALLALAPLAGADLVESVVIDAKSGVSGAGRGGGERLSFVSVTENLTPYGVEGHRHLPEIEQGLDLLGNAAADVTFVPHLLPIDQGLLASCYVTLAEPTSAEALAALFAERYAGEPFVELVTEPPGVRDVRETNLCRIHVAGGGRRALVFAAIDNLWKGAASQAVQNLNLMLGFDEGEGLR